MNQPDPEPTRDMEAKLQNVLEERLEDLEYARRSSTSTPDMRDDFLGQMKAGIQPPSAQPSLDLARRRRVMWMATGAAAAAAAVLFVLQGRGNSGEVIDRGALMHDGADQAAGSVSLVSMQDRRVTVNLGAGFLPAGYYHARAKTPDGAPVAESRGDSSEQWTFLIPEDLAVPEALVIEVDLFMEGATLPESSWSSELRLAE